MSSLDDAYCPDDGDFIWIDFDPRLGHEQAGRRPALVLSPRSYNRKVGLCVVCPVTGRSKGFPFEVSVPEGLEVRGVVLADQVRSVSWGERQAAYFCPAPQQIRRDVRATLKALLSF